jgi:4-amino-4-deoxy-L-arabinose transferase-like glycosyltransferase
MEGAVEKVTGGQPGLKRVQRWILICIVSACFGFHVWGVQRDLPYSAEPDEPIFVTRAVPMATTGDLNPGWFGNPGSTLIYPLAAFYHIWNAVTHGGSFFQPDPGLQAAFDANQSEFYLLGRFLSIAYAVMSVPLVFQVGRRAFGEEAGLIGSWFWVLSPIAVSHATLVRTDSVSTFFGLLGLWACLRVYEHPSTRNQVVAGLALGLSIASKYYLVALIPVLLAVDGLILWRESSHAHGLRKTWPGVVAGLVAVPVVFVLSTPYLVLDFATALRDARAEMRPYHLGSDGLSPPENVLWYLSIAFPRNLGWPRMVLATLGMVLAVWWRRSRQMLLAGFVIVFWVGISLSSLHWERWIFPVLPVLALFAAGAVVTLVEYLSERLRFNPSVQRALIGAAVVLISVWPAYRLIMLDIRLAKPSTRVLAREWIVRNLPPGSRIVLEKYSAPLYGTDFDAQEYGLLGASGYTLDDAYRFGIRYAVVSSAVYSRFMAEPDHYPSEVAFYQTLFEKGHLLQEFVPSATRGGPIIRIYELPGP